MSKQKPIWLEDESHYIGRNLIPNDLFAQMRSAPVVEMQVPVDKRVKHLVNVYSDYPIEGLETSVKKINRRLGGLRTKQALEALQEKDFSTVAKMALAYYDKAYTYGLSQRDPETVYHLELNSIDHEQNAHEIITFYKERIRNKVLEYNGN